MPTLHSDGRPDAHASADVSANTAETVVALGRLLRRARELRGLTLQEVAKETKIPQRRLEALERDTNASELDDFYRRAEIRAYARAVHFDERLALTELDRAAQVSAPQTPVPEQPPVPTLWSAKRLLTLLGVVGAAALFAAMTQAESLLRREARVDPIEPPYRQSGATTPPAPIHEAVPSPQPAQLEPPPSPAELPASPQHRQPAANSSPGARNDSRVVQEAPGTRASADPLTELVVATQPEGARVTVNGIGWGTAPVTIRHLPAGVKRIRISKDGYATEERVLHVTEGQTTRLAIRLRPSGP